jgi:glyoxylase-like metal-dependent hydrolase (beta-lactamase superfamily II)
VSNFTVRKIIVGPMATNAYLLRCAATKEQILIDAGGDARRLISAIRTDPLVAVVTTHSDIDHCDALADVVEATGARSVAYPDDANDLDVPTDKVEDGDCLTFGECSARVIHIGGHTPGSIVLSVGTVLLTGDCLFPGGVGATFGNKDDFETLLDNVEQRIFAQYPDPTVVLPGHGPHTTLGAERSALPEWRSRGW